MLVKAIFSTSLHSARDRFDTWFAKNVWESAGAINAQGEGFLPNMPTEEVFTAPDFRRADGYVASTKPLSYNGNIIEGRVFKVTFKDETNRRYRC